MKAKPKTSSLWVVYVVAFDDSDDTEQSHIEPFVGKEPLEAKASDELTEQEARLISLVRGGQLVAIVEGDEAAAEHVRKTVEADVIRK